MKNIVPIALLGGVLFLIWRKPAAATAGSGSTGAFLADAGGGGGILEALTGAADNFTSALAGKPADEGRTADTSGEGLLNIGGAPSAPANAVNVGGVTNNTSNNQNTITIGNDTRAEVGGPLVIGGTNIGAVLFGGTPDTPPPPTIFNGRSDDPNQIGGIVNNVNNTQNTITIGNDSVFHVGSGRRPARDADFSTFYDSNQFAVRPGDIYRGNNALGNIFPSSADFAANYDEGGGQFQQFRRVDPLDWIASLWNAFFGNAIAFPGQPVN